MLSSKCKYAIRAVLFLAVGSSPKKKFGGKHIAKSLKIPSPFLGKILQDLVRKKLISSIKGPGGGFYMTEDNLSCTIIDVFDAIDGLSFFNSCVIGLENCSDSHPCPIHHEFKESRVKIEELFSSKTIQDLSSEIDSQDIYLVV